MTFDHSSFREKNKYYLFCCDLYIIKDTASMTCYKYFNKANGQSLCEKVNSIIYVYKRREYSTRVFFLKQEYSTRLLYASMKYSSNLISGSRVGNKAHH
jgi:hypothetical protein